MINTINERENMSRSKEDLEKRLLMFDEEAFLLYDDSNEKFICYLVGGAALVLLNCISRMTHDGDFIYFAPKELSKIMPKYDFNANVTAFITMFPDGYLERAKKIELNTKKIDFYVLSLEDLVVSKLSAARDKDLIDIRNSAVLSKINWSKLEMLADLCIEGMISDTDINTLKYYYNEYIEECKK